MIIIFSFILAVHHKLHLIFVENVRRFMIAGIFFPSICASRVLFCETSLPSFLLSVYWLLLSNLRMTLYTIHRLSYGFSLERSALLYCSAKLLQAGSDAQCETTGGGLFLYLLSGLLAESLCFWVSVSSHSNSINLYREPLVLPNQ